MVTMGLVSLVFAAFMLYRRRDIKRLFAYSSIEHMGIIAFAFGMGGPLANFAGLLHMVLHSLTKSAIFFGVGHIAQVKGTQKMADIGGLPCRIRSRLGTRRRRHGHRGAPAAGIFMTEFLRDLDICEPLLAIRWSSVCWWRSAPCPRVNSLAWARPERGATQGRTSRCCHLALVLLAGSICAPLVSWFRMSRVTRMTDRCQQRADWRLRRAAAEHRPWPRA
jgi:hydrogenase-4 component F